MSKGIKSRARLGRKRESLDWKEIGHRIRELRGFDITQGEFAKAIGLSQGHLSHIERGEKEIGAEILLNIGRQFGRSIEWLLTGEDNNRDSHASD
jgi:transcriptional regulator with XRE-family HTH domain